jgi:hypothetical protein
MWEVRMKELAVARLAIALARWHALRAKHGDPAALDDARLCGGAGLRQLRLALLEVAA